MTVKEVIEKYKNEWFDFEIWKYNDVTERLHTDYIKNLDSYLSFEELQNAEVKYYELMDSKQYNNTILANSSVNADFFEWYDNESAKVLVIVLPFEY